MLIHDCDCCDGFAFWHGPNHEWLCDDCYQELVARPSPPTGTAERPGGRPILPSPSHPSHGRPLHNP